jgi:hypothetical protein
MNESTSESSSDGDDSDIDAAPLSQGFEQILEKF